MKVPLGREPPVGHGGHPVPRLQVVHILPNLLGDIRFRAAVGTTRVGRCCEVQEAGYQGRLRPSLYNVIHRQGYMGAADRSRGRGKRERV